MSSKPHSGIAGATQASVPRQHDQENRFSPVIAASGTSSNGFQSGLIGARGWVIITPGTWTAADIGFSVSLDDSTYYPLEDDSGSRIKITGVETGKAVVCPAGCWALGAFPYARIDSLDTSDESAEAQAVAATLTVVGLY